MLQSTLYKLQVEQQRTYHYYVDLVSKELDWEGVPEDEKMIDVVVLEPTLEAITAVVAAAGWLSNYTITSYWVPCDEDEF